MWIYGEMTAFCLIFNRIFPASAVFDRANSIQRLACWLSLLDRARMAHSKGEMEKFSVVDMKFAFFRAKQLSAFNTAPFFAKITLHVQ